LVEAAVGGEPRAFAALYGRRVGRVYRHVYHRVGNRDDAEDLTQPLFLNAWRAIGRYRPTGAPFVAWLLAIAQNAVAAFHRRRSAVAERAPVAAPAAPWGGPEAEALAAHERAAVRTAVLRLAPDKRRVVTMGFVEDRGYAQIAAALGTREASVRALQRRALHELRGLLARQLPR
jgi:RNA polymerase sigma-70 factor (ECF subfamily)